MIRTLWMTLAALLLLTLAIPAHARSHRAPPPAPSFLSFFQSTPTPVTHHVRHRHRAMGGSRVAVASVVSSSSDVVAAARSQIGNGPIYGRRNLWCARFMNYVLERTGYKGTGSDLAWSFSRLPSTEMHVGAIAVMRHHVGVVSGVTSSGDPIIISGNHGSRVREAVYPRRRIAAFVVPR